jgi:hypothetical protein
MSKTYAGKEVDVSFDPEVCTHAATDESQGGWAKDFGGRIGRVVGRGGLRSPPVRSVRRARRVSVWFLPEFAQE